MAVLKGIVAAISLVAMLGLITFAALYAFNNFSNDSDKPQRDVKVIIPEGMNATDIGKLLEDKGVIKSAFVFKMTVRQKGVGSDLKPGEYDLKTGMEYDEVIDILAEGPKIVYVDITFPEGWLAKQMAARLEALTGISPEEYLQIVESGQVEGNYAFLQDNGAPSKNLEGYLFPNTYTVEKEEITAQEFIKTQLDQFQKATSGLDWSKAESLGRTPYEIIVIASLIERETMVDDERPLVAAVIYNRLNKGMPLQIDATVQYALPKWKERLTYEDLKVDSPYNTYKQKGLPPGPICNPGLDSIDAALNPSLDDYLYYVLKTDNSGRHVFTNSYSEFTKAANEYRAYIREKQKQKAQEEQLAPPIEENPQGE